jgi:hypothetical protein
VNNTLNNNSINTVNLNSKFINMNIKLNEIKFEDLVQVAKSWGVDLPNEGYWTGNSLSQAIQTLCWGEVYTPKDIDIFYTKNTNDFEENQLSFNSYGDLKNNELDIICTEVINTDNYIYIEKVYVLWNDHSYYKGFINTFLNRYNVLNYMGVIVDLSTGSLSWNLGYEDFISNRIINIKFSNQSSFSSLVKKALNKADTENLSMSNTLNVIIRLQKLYPINIDYSFIILLESNNIDIINYVLDNNISSHLIRHLIRHNVVNITTRGLLDLEDINPFINVFLNANANRQVDWNTLIEGIEEILGLEDLLVPVLMDYRSTNLFLVNSIRYIIGDRYDLLPQDIYDELLSYIIPCQESNNGSYEDITSYNPKFKSKAGIRFYGLEVEYVTTCNPGMSNEDIRSYLKDNKLGKVVTDSSCGFEIVSTPWEYEDLITYIDLLPLQEVMVNSSCGVHIHVSRDIFTPLMLGRLLVFINDPDNNDYIISKVGRSANSYCQIKNKGNDPNNVELYSYDRYEAINLTNLSDDKYTIEFRMFASTKDKDTIKSYVKWLDTMITLSMTNDLSIDLIESYL